MGDYTFILHIDSKVLDFQSGDNLCIAKKVNGAFTTVFQDAAVRPKRIGQKSLTNSNTFGWKDEYQVFATATYQHGLLLGTITDGAEISFGQRASYENNHFKPGTPAPADAFTNSSGNQSKDDSFLVNGIPNTQHIGVQIKTGDTWVPVYVDPDVHNGLMDHQLTPKNEYIIFWSSSVETSSMIDEAKCPNPKHFSYTGSAKSITLRYGYRAPDAPENPQEQPYFY